MTCYVKSLLELIDSGDLSDDDDVDCKRFCNGPEWSKINVTHTTIYFCRFVPATYRSKCPIRSDHLAARSPMLLWLLDQNYKLAFYNENFNYVLIPRFSRFSFSYLITLQSMHDCGKPLSVSILN